jgi:hypothetical protein
MARDRRNTRSYIPGTIGEDQEHKPSSLLAVEGRAPELQQLERDRAVVVNTNMPLAVIRVSLCSALS